MKVTIITAAWNYKDYVPKCIESVLNQTFKDFEYFILDNGSTDGTKEIIEKYAAQDDRIKVYRREENILNDTMWIDFPLKHGMGKYFMCLDCDDWIEPDCLERLVRIAEAGDFDITVTGSYLHNEFTSTVTKRCLPERMCVERKDFANRYPSYHFFFRTTWGKLIKTDIIKAVPPDKRKNGLTYGGDTLHMFTWLRKANKICIDNSAMYHYILHKSSAFTTFNDDKVYSNVVLYNDAVDFLSGFGPISSENQEFLYRVYASGISDVSNTLPDAELSTADKVRAYYGILCASVTKEAFKMCDAADVKRSRSKLLSETLYFTAQLDAPLKEYEEVFSYYLPYCGRIISYKTAKLILKEKELADAVLIDNSSWTAEILIKLAASGKYAKEYDIIGMLGVLSQNKPLLCSIKDAEFFGKYGSIYLLVWGGKYDEALDEMTDILLKKKCSNETFFQLYLSIAAVRERVDEFIFGKIKLAEFYCSKRRYDECRGVLNDLADMGVEDNEDIVCIKENPEFARFINSSTM